MAPMIRALLFTTLLFASGEACSGDLLTSLEGVWNGRVATAVFSVDTKTQTATYCYEGRCTEGAFTVKKTVGKTIFLTITGQESLSLVVYLKDGGTIAIAEEGEPSFTFERER